MRISVYSFSYPLKLKGKFVELQRLSSGQWTRIRRARFSARRPGAFSTTFTVKQRGLILRAFVPAESAGPCYAATASKTWSSGAASPAGSDRVIDGTYACSVGRWGGIRVLSVSASGLVPTQLTPMRSFGVGSKGSDGGPLAAANTESLSLSPTLCTASRTRVPLVTRGLGGGRYQASVRTWGTLQVMKGRAVELQRLEDGQWLQVQRAPLAGSGVRFYATFSVRTAGLTLRVLVPTQSAGPCYTATASETWVSEEPGPPSPGALVIDRSVLCSISPRGGLRQISIQANSALPEAARVASFTVLSADARLAQGSTGYLELHAARCIRTKASIRLSTTKLRSRPPGSLGREFKCGAPPRVLIRVRAVFQAPTALQRGRPYGWPALTAEGAVTQASLAIRTQARKPLVFASLSQSGQARFFVARSCVED